MDRYETEVVLLKRIAELEAVIAEYAAKYGLTERARAAMLMPERKSDGSGGSPFG